MATAKVTSSTSLIGGQRAIKDTSADSVAIAKLRSETGGQLQRGTLQAMQQDGVSGGSGGSFPFVHWGADSKYALFVWS